MDAPNINLTVNCELEFDTYTDKIREASVFFVKTGPSTDRWNIEWCPCHRTVMQFGSDGGARVVHGITRPDATIIMIQTNKTPDDVFFDGQSMKWHDLALLAPGAHFTFASKSPAQWVALSVPPNLVGQPESTKKKGISFQTRNLAMTLSKAGATRLASAAKRARKLIHELDNSNDESITSVIEAELLSTLNDVLADPLNEIRIPDRHLLALEEKISRALEYVRSRHFENVSVSDLASAAGITTRSLNRCFRGYLLLGPKEYLKLRQLNLVRRALRLEASSQNSVTRTMAQYGVTEFGRFATEYKLLFGELPSSTFMRHRSVQAHQSGPSAGSTL